MTGFAYHCMWCGKKIRVLVDIPSVTRLLNGHCTCGPGGHTIVVHTSGQVYVKQEGTFRMEAAPANKPAKRKAKARRKKP